jgi:hypothetical protein
MNEKSPNEKENKVTTFSLDAAKLEFGKILWINGILMQIALLVLEWTGRAANIWYFWHIISMALFTISAYLIGTRFKKIDYSSESAGALLELKNGFRTMAIIGYILLILAIIMPKDRLLNNTNIISNLSIVTGNINYAIIVWGITCLSFYGLRYLITIGSRNVIKK